MSRSRKPPLGPPPPPTPGVGNIARPSPGAPLIPPEWMNAIREDFNRPFLAFSEQTMEMMREHERRLDCEFLGIDPDRVPTLYERLRATYRRRRRDVLHRVHGLREQAAKRVAPWLLNEWEASDRYADD